MKFLKKRKKWITVGGFLVLTVLLTNCKKEYSYEGGDTFYKLESSDGFCEGNIGGSYTAGTILNASNTFTISVTVITPGSFAITTQRVNGVSFYYSNRFTNTGNQNVTLVGSGTPFTVGNFTVTTKIEGSTSSDGQVCNFTMAVK